MSMRYLAGFITASYNPLKVPNAPTITTVTPGNTQLTVAFTAPSNVGGGAITSYIAIATTSAGVVFTATGSATPITITGLTNGTAYTVQVAAVNAFGPGPYSVGVSGTPIPPTLLYSWGENNNGQLGQNNIVNLSSPSIVGSGANWAIVVLGQGNGLATKTDGTLWSWGLNDKGQLGQNDTVNRSSPVQIGALTTWLSIGSGGYHSFAIKNDGTLWSWGKNDQGQLGQNNTVSRSSPVQIGALTTWQLATGGDNFSAAIKTDGTLWSWGYNLIGQLGTNNRTSYSSPVQVGALTNWLSVSCGNYHTIAIKTDGTIWTCGYNVDFGQLGLNDRINRSSPVQVGALTTWSTVSAGKVFCLATKTDGTLWSWGRNDRGQLGQNIASTINRSSPVQIGADTNWSKIGATLETGYAIKTTGTLWAWGINSQGQVGDLTSITRSSPVQVGSATTWLYPPSGSVSTAALAISN